eukprot:gene4229-8414_t
MITLLLQRNVPTPVHHSDAGRGGRNGKEGKAGKVAKAIKKGKTMKDGECGSVSFCLYDTDGMMQSAGTPYRIVLNKTDVDKLTPVSMIATKECKDEPLYFGETVVFGPILPLNIGSLYAPPSKLTGSLTIPILSSTSASSPSSPSKPRHVHEYNEVTFPRIPGEEKTKYGLLAQSFAKQIQISIPRLSNTGFLLSNTSWPWAMEGSMPLSFKSTFHIQFEIGKYVQRGSDDGKHICQKPPVEIAMDAASGRACNAPMGIECASGTPYKISFVIRNKVKCATGASPDLSGYTYKLWVAGERFCPKLSFTPSTSSITATSSTSSVIDSSHTPTTLHSKPLHLVSASGDVASVLATASTASVPVSDQKEQDKELEFTVSIPGVSNELSAGQEVRPGGFIHTRCELYCDGKLIQHSAPTSMRLVAPRPPINMEARPTDVLVFCSYQQSPEDYEAIEKISALLRMRVFFLDYSHFKDRNTGVLSVDYWTALHGKVIVVWAPATTGQEAVVTSERLLSHLRGNGGLICADTASASFNLPADCSGSLSFKSKEARRLVHAPQGLSLSSLKTDMQIQNITLPAPISKTIPQLTGTHAVIFAMNLLSSLSMSQKIAFIQSHIKDIGEASVAIGMSLLDVYYSPHVDSGCCGCGGSKKIIPVLKSKSPCTVVDILLMAMKTDLLVDIVAYDKFQNMSFCQSLTVFFHTMKHCAGNDRFSVLLAYYMAALGIVTNISSKTLFINNNNNITSKAWEKGHRYEATSSMNSCITICERQHMDYESLAMRIKSADVIKGCIPLTSMGNVTDLSVRKRKVVPYNEYPLETEKFQDKFNGNEIIANKESGP